MIKEFEGRTEQEAIDNAVESLHIDSAKFDVEVIEREKGGLFKKPRVKIRVHIALPDEELEQEEPVEAPAGAMAEIEDDGYVIDPKHIDACVKFITDMVEKMGYPAEVSVTSVVGSKLQIDIESEYSSILIGRKGKNLDAIQILANVYAGNLDNHIRLVVDSENYRIRHEEAIVKMAYKVASQVKRSGKSQLLEPMNPFERRLVHTALNDITGIATKSEGEGLFRQVRVLCSYGKKDKEN